MRGTSRAPPVGGAFPMRCTRCDRIAVPQAIGRTADDLIVFGWCLDCLAEEGCTLIETDWAPFGLAPRRSRRRRARPAAQPANPSRRLAYFLVGGMAAWTLTLMVLGLVSLCAPTGPEVGPLSRGFGQRLITAGLLAGATGLALWAATLDRGLATRALQAASALVALALVAYLVLRHNRRRDPWIAGMVAVALGVSSWARRAGRSARLGARTGLRPAIKTGVLGVDGSDQSAS